ncbi:hypothetical protein P152DRAFT_461396, partial [Eremomyces bilateralis CBS 781.70]
MKPILVRNKYQLDLRLGGGSYGEVVSRLVRIQRILQGKPNRYRRSRPSNRTKRRFEARVQPTQSFTSY